MHKRFLLIGIFFFHTYTLWGFEQKSFVIIIPSYNNALYYKQNLDSVFAQDYPQFRVIYIDDCSPDGTGDLVKQYLEERDTHGRCTLIQNVQRRGAMANHYRAAHMCDPHEIIIHLDGDDWFADAQAVTYLNTLYQDPTIWLTYGQYKTWPRDVVSCCYQIPEWVIEHGAYRSYPFVMSHLRTFYASLFHEIALEDLLLDGTFVGASPDLACCMPLLEMVNRHSFFNEKILCIYNISNPINEYKVYKAKQDLVAYRIRDKKPYKPLDALPQHAEKSPSVTPLLIVTEEQDEHVLASINAHICYEQGYVIALGSAKVPDDARLTRLDTFATLQAATFETEYVLVVLDHFERDGNRSLMDDHKMIERTQAVGCYMGTSLQQLPIMLDDYWGAYQLGYHVQKFQLPAPHQSMLYRALFFNQLLEHIQTLANFSYVFYLNHVQDKIMLFCGR